MKQEKKNCSIYRFSILRAFVCLFVHVIGVICRSVSYIRLHIRFADCVISVKKMMVVYFLAHTTMIMMMMLCLDIE